jgi:transmembrane 9 superfamily member 2/4
MIPSLKMNMLSSSKTQVPYEYYSLPYCRPDNIVSSAENRGEVLRGDIVNSRYQVRVKFPLLANALDHGQS